MAEAGKDKRLIPYMHSSQRQRTGDLLRVFVHAFFMPSGLRACLNAQRKSPEAVWYCQSGMGVLHSQPVPSTANSLADDSPQRLSFHMLVHNHSLLHAAHCFLTMIALIGAWRQPRWYAKGGRAPVVVMLRVAPKLCMLMEVLCCGPLLQGGRQGAVVRGSTCTMWLSLMLGCLCSRVPMRVHLPTSCLELLLMVFIRTALLPAPLPPLHLAAFAAKLAVFGLVLPTMLTNHIMLSCSRGSVDIKARWKGVRISVQGAATAGRLEKPSTMQHDGNLCTSAGTSSVEGGEGAPTTGCQREERGWKRLQHVWEGDVQLPAEDVAGGLGKEALAESAAAEQERRDMMERMVLEVHEEVTRRRAGRSGRESVAFAYTSPVRTMVTSVKIHDHRAYHLRAPIMAAVEEKLREAYQARNDNNSGSPLITSYAVQGCLQLLIKSAEHLCPSWEPCGTCCVMEHCTADAGSDAGSSNAHVFTSLASHVQSCLSTMNLSPRLQLSTSSGVRVDCGEYLEGAAASGQVVPVAAPVPVLSSRPGVVCSGCGEEVEVVVPLGALGVEEREVELLLLYRKGGEQATLRHRLALPLKEYRLPLPSHLDAGPLEMSVLDTRPGLEGALLGLATSLALPPAAARELATFLQQPPVDARLHSHLQADLAVALQIPTSFTPAALQQSKALLSSLMNFFIDHDMPHCYSSLMQHCLQNSSRSVWKHTTHIPPDPRPVVRPTITTRVITALRSAAATLTQRRQTQPPRRPHHITSPQDPSCAAGAPPTPHPDSAAAPSLPLSLGTHPTAHPDPAIVETPHVLGLPAAPSAAHPASTSSSMRRRLHASTSSPPIKVPASSSKYPSLDGIPPNDTPTLPPRGLPAILHDGYLHWCAKYSMPSNVAAIAAITIYCICFSLKAVHFFPAHILASHPSAVGTIKLTASMYTFINLLAPVSLVLGGQQFLPLRSLVILSSQVCTGVLVLLGSTCHVLYPKAIFAKLAVRKLPLVVVKDLVFPALLHVPWYVQLLGSGAQEVGFFLLLASPCCSNDPSINMDIPPLSLQQNLTMRLGSVVTAVVTSVLVDWLCWRERQGTGRAGAQAGKPGLSALK